MANSLLLPSLWTKEILVAYSRGLNPHYVRNDNPVHPGSWFMEQGDKEAYRANRMSAFLLGGIYLVALLVWWIF